MATLAEAFDSHRHLYSPVPMVTEPYVCDRCLGVVNPPWDHCYPCTELFSSQAAQRLLGQIVPMTGVISPSPWYTALLTYKTFSWKKYSQALGALAGTFLSTHAARIEALLGGPTDLYTVVPSTRRRGTFEAQPLVRVVNTLRNHGVSASECLTHTDGIAKERGKCQPSLFQQGPVSCDGRRVVLVDDTWTTGSAAVSAGVSLLNHGATGVIVLPIARMIRADYVGEFPDRYRAVLRGEYEPDSWPLDGVA